VKATAPLGDNPVAVNKHIIAVSLLCFHEYYQLSVCAKLCDGGYSTNLCVHRGVCFRQVHILFQSEFSRKCDLVLPHSVSSIFSFA